MTFSSETGDGSREFGGGVLTDLMVRWIDVATGSWTSNMPLLATTIGNHFAREGVWETPDTSSVLARIPGQDPGSFRGNHLQSRFGSDDLLRGNPKDRSTSTADGTKFNSTIGLLEVEAWILGSNPKKGQDFYDKPDGELLRLTNWLECIRSRNRPEAPVEAGVAAAGAAQLGNRGLSHRPSRRVEAGLSRPLKPARGSFSRRLRRCQDGNWNGLRA